jgi:hypothetical protein
LEWHKSTLIEGDLADRVRALKAEPGGELQVHGSGHLIQTLLRQGLIDEFRLWKLVESRTSPPILRRAVGCSAEIAITTGWYASDERDQRIYGMRAGLAEPHHESKAKFLDAALHVIRAKGYSATRIEDICEAAGLSKGSFFHHFKTKEELALAAADHFQGQARASGRDRVPSPPAPLPGDPVRPPP